MADKKPAPTLEKEDFRQLVSHIDNYMKRKPRLDQEMANRIKKLRYFMSPIPRNLGGLAPIDTTIELFYFKGNRKTLKEQWYKCFVKDNKLVELSDIPPYNFSLFINTIQRDLDRHELFDSDSESDDFDDDVDRTDSESDDSDDDTDRTDSKENHCSQQPQAPSRPKTYKTQPKAPTATKDRVTVLTSYKNYLKNLKTTTTPSAKDRRIINCKLTITRKLGNDEPISKREENYLSIHRNPTIHAVKIVFFLFTFPVSLPIAFIVACFIGAIIRKNPLHLLQEQTETKGETMLRELSYLKPR